MNQNGAAGTRDDWGRFSHIDLEARVTPEILARGLAYYYDGHLLQAFRIGPVRAGILAGTGGNYQARLWFEDGTLYSECSCPFQGFCKHLAAVAFGWLTEPEFFTDLQPELSRVISDPSLLQNTFLRLCYKNPFNFWELQNQSSVSLAFHSARGILNLIRNTFSSPRQPMDNGAQTWERVKRLQELLATELRCGSPEAVTPLVELIKGLVAVYLDFPSEPLLISFQETTAVFQEIPSDFQGAWLEPVLEVLLAIYFEPKLWEWQQSCRKGILMLVKRIPNQVYLWMSQKNLTVMPTLELISLYELFTSLISGSAIPAADASARDFLTAVEQLLIGRCDGLLWLIDRWLEEKPEFSFRLAKEGMRRKEPDLRNSLQDRLVKLHCRRGELKQAASLSFALFKGAPSIEEYLRLQSILRDRPLEGNEYYQKAVQFLEGQNRPENGNPSLETSLLLVRIAVLERNFEVIQTYCRAPRQNAGILQEIAKRCTRDYSSAWGTVYPLLIRALLADGSPEIWKITHQVLIVYKKTCFQEQWVEEWNQFCRELKQTYRDDRRFHQKFGALLITD